MKAVGFNIANGTLRWAAVEGTLEAPLLIDSGKLDYDSGGSLANRMAWFRDSIAGVLDGQDVRPPHRVAYRMHMGRGMTQEQVAVFHYPYGVLLLACAGRGIVDPVEFTGSSMTAKRFGLARGVKPMEAVNEILKPPRPPWDDAQRYAVCVAWGALA